MSHYVRKLPPATALLAAWLVVTALGSAQSLGELARREGERRSSEPRKAKKIYTNDDFFVATAREEKQIVPLQPLQRQADKQRREDTTELEKKWRQRFAEARARLRETEQRCWQTRIQTVFVRGGGLSGMTSGAAVPVQMQIRECLETEELRQARKALAELEEELRRAGLPPGWARE